MNAKTIIVLPALALAGCLSSAPKAPKCWLFESEGLPPINAVSVNAPYDDSRFAVLRSDGSVAFDGFNVFAARPSVLIGNVTAAGKGGYALRVRRLALDARQEGRLDALVEVTLSKDGKSASGTGRAPAEDGRYSAAFTKALAAAVREAAKAHR